MSLTRALWLLGALLLACAVPRPCEAQSGAWFDAGQTARSHTYQVLRRDPVKAAAWDLLLPGAGSAYVGLYVNTVISAAVSLAGAALWIHGGVRDNDAIYWTGVGLFAAGRTYGVASAAVGAVLLNRALRRQLQVGISPGRMVLRF